MTEAAARNATQKPGPLSRGLRRIAGLPGMGRVLRVREDERGNSTIEFVILFPLIMLMFFNAFESGVMMIRYAMLERGVDMAVRSIRLGTSIQVEEDDVRQMVCSGAGLIPDCMSAVKVEMIRIDPRNYARPNVDADCVNRNDPAVPLRNFATGGTNDLMVLRICALFDPMFPLAGLGFQMQTDGGEYALVSTHMFVMEPG